MSDKLDLTKLWKAEYVAPRKPVILELGPMTYLAVEGKGEPGGAEFPARVGALYAMAYTVKMTRKFDGRQDYTVSKLEAQWWGAGKESCFAKLPKSAWRWRLLIRTPEFVSAEELASARAALRKRGKGTGTEEVRLFSLTEGCCAQMLHVGPYQEEGTTVEKMLAFAAGRGLVPHGLHHEIYISDPRRVPPERLKTILRQPLVPGAARK